MDKITIERIKILHPNLVNEANKIYEEVSQALTGNVICRFSHTLRTFNEQSQLYAQGRTKPGKIVTNAKAGLSFHNYGLAIDIVLLIDKNKDGNYETASWDRFLDGDNDKKADWQEIVTIFKQYGWEWGGDWKFKDYPHFQKTFGFSVRELLNRYNKKEFVSGSKYVKLSK
jgi:peptidoglycan L-alanyl-D-glutamate endopeptidase CwlK